MKYIINKIKYAGLIIAFGLNSLNAHWKVVLTGQPSKEFSNLVTELKKNNYEFSTSINENEDKKNPYVKFIDRSEFDSQKLLDDSYKLENEIKTHIYDLVFFISANSKNSEDYNIILKEKYNKGGYLTIIQVPQVKPEEQVSFIKRTISDRFLLGDVMDCFAGFNNIYKIQPFMEPIRYIEAQDNYGQTLRFFGVHKDNQNQINFPEFKKRILDLIGATNKKVVQVVGDSGRGVFSKEGSDYASSVLENEFKNCGIIEYGYTGYSGQAEKDVNAIVNEYVDKHPEIGNKVLANIVGHIHIASNKWGCYASPFVKNFVIVYNNDGMTKNPKYDAKGNQIEGFTVFSDDTTISDHFLQPEDDDVTVSLEGGTQCWKQVTNMLHRSTKAHLIYNIRIPNKQHHFSVARILKEFYDKQPKSQEEAEKVRINYQKSLEHLWDTKRLDNSDLGYDATKKRLLNDSMIDIIDGGLYKKVPEFCKFFDAKITHNNC